MALEYIVDRGDYELHRSFVPFFAVQAFKDAIVYSIDNCYTMPRLTIFDGKYIEYEYYPQPNGCCEIVKCSAPPNRVYRSTAYALQHIEDIG
jgi:hypothetical protein